MAYGQGLVGISGLGLKGLSIVTSLASGYI